MNAAATFNPATAWFDELTMSALIRRLPEDAGSALVAVR
jgi:hypothetical protein